MCIAHTSKILLSSYDAQKDLKKVSEKAYKKSAVSQFYFESPKKGHLLSLNYLRNKFKLSNKFFYLPNQYWVHKNHITVLKALKYLKRENPRTIAGAVAKKWRNRRGAETPESIALKEKKATTPKMVRFRTPSPNKEGGKR